MPLKRKAIVLVDHEKALLEQLYLNTRITIEQLEIRQDDLQHMLNAWRNQTGRTESNEHVLHYMRTKRKQKKWPRLEGAQQRAVTLPRLSPEETEHLIDIFYEDVARFGNGSDTLGYEPEVVAQIEADFRHRTDRQIPGPQLVGILTALRKRGFLPKVRKQSENDDLYGFEDIGLVG
ncbi:hypothetical protein [Planctopirus hydrillae]|uniref:Uncharacterized protein n=1 Tax=Planctopirus hydrillae TaxID=1841610 RepID=A0A1C3EBB1_9PLAN|nr:hypothetical protein [Planctopirus hydrillae]ODA30522.1 hypothetical protein A6X21_05685 [Planctopirus hydrillae]